MDVERLQCGYFLCLCVGGGEESSYPSFCLFMFHKDIKFNCMKYTLKIII